MQGWGGTGIGSCRRLMGWSRWRGRGRGCASCMSDWDAVGRTKQPKALSKGFNPHECTQWPSLTATTVAQIRRNCGRGSHIWPIYTRLLWQTCCVAQFTQFTLRHASMQTAALISKVGGQRTHTNTNTQTHTHTYVSTLAHSELLPEETINQLRQKVAQKYE